MSSYYAIWNRASQLAIDIQGNSTTNGALLDAFTLKSSDNQLWEFVPDPAGSGYFFIKSKLNGNVIDIQESSMVSGAALDAWPQKAAGYDNQLWQFFKDPATDWYFIMSKLTGNVIDIRNGSTSPGTLLDSWPQNFPSTDGQLWMVVDGEFPATVDAVPPPPASKALESNSNYIFNQSCNPFVDTSTANNPCLTVQIEVTEDIVWKSGTGSTPGFSFQLNCYSPQFSWCSFQQYVIGVEGNNLVYDINTWPVSGGPLINIGPQNLLSMPGTTIPAGYKLVIALNSDQKTGVITAASFFVYSPDGIIAAYGTQTILSISGANPEDIAPIVAFELNFVGPEGGEIVVLSQGSGTITYSVPYRMTLSNVRPSCKETGDFTREQANSVYSPLPACKNNIFKQRFGVT